MSKAPTSAAPRPPAKVIGNPGPGDRIAWTTQDGERERLLPYVPDQYIRAVEAVQPFQSPQPLEDPLHDLHSLAAIDRHRTIHLVSAITSTQHVSWSRARAREDDPEIAMYRPAVAPGQLVLRLPPDPETSFTPAFEVKVVLGEADRLAIHQEVTAKADQLLNHVVYVVGRIGSAQGQG